LEVIANLFELGFYAGFVATVVAVVAAIARRWQLVRHVCNATTLGGLLSLALGLSIFVLLAFGAPHLNALLVPANPNDETDPANRARLLAESISVIMNCGASTLVLVLLPSVLLRVISGRRLRAMSGN
jgi:hypothetical protein